jgi:hypothetical protein
VSGEVAGPWLDPDAVRDTGAALVVGGAHDVRLEPLAGETFVVDAQPAAGSGWQLAVEARQNPELWVRFQRKVMQAAAERFREVLAAAGRRGEIPLGSDRLLLADTLTAASCCCGPSPPSGRPRPTPARQRLLDRTLALYVATGQ